MATASKALSVALTVCRGDAHLFVPRTTKFADCVRYNTFMNRLNKKRQLSPLEQFADRCIHWIGSPASLIVHSLFFITSLTLGVFGVPWVAVLLVLNTTVSLEAIYLAILIQISINRNTKSLEEVEENIDEIQENVGDIEESLEELELDGEEESHLGEGGRIIDPEPDPVATMAVTSRSALENFGGMENIK